MVGKGDTLLNKEQQPCLADKEAAWEIDKKPYYKTQRASCRLRLLLFALPVSVLIFSVSNRLKEPRAKLFSLFITTTLPPSQQLSGINCI